MMKVMKRRSNDYVTFHELIYLGKKLLNIWLTWLGNIMNKIQRPRRDIIVSWSKTYWKSCKQLLVVDSFCFKIFWTFTQET